MIIRPGFEPSSSLRPTTRPVTSGAGDGFSPGQAEETGLLKPVRHSPGPPAPRPLWSEVERLGLWASCNAITSPLTTVMSAPGVADLKTLLGEFDQAGFRFSDIGDPSNPRQWGSTDRDVDSVHRIIAESSHNSNMFERMTLSQPLAQAPEERMFGRTDKDVVKQVKIHNFRDLKDAESIFLAKDYDRLEHPELARRLDRLESAGVKFRVLESPYTESEALKNNYSRPVGVYGAYRAWLHDPKEAESLFASGHPARSPADLDVLEFFALGASVPALDRDPLARRLRDLDSIGITFYRGDDYEPTSAAGIFHAINGQGYSGISVSLNGTAREKLDLLEAKIPQPSRKLLELAEFHSRVIAPDPELTANEKHFYAQGLTWATADRPLESVLATIHELRDFEAGLNPELTGETRTRMGVVSTSNLMRALGQGQQPADLMAEFKELRARGVKPEVASQALVHFREKLRPQTFDESEYREERERILELSEVANSFEDASAARGLLKMEVAEPYPDRLEALRHLVGVERGLVDERTWSSKTSAVQEAMLDYRTLLASPRSSLKQAAGLLGELNKALVPRLGHSGSREMFDYLQRGITRKAFGPEAVAVFAREFDLGQDVEYARGFLKPEPPVGEPYELRARVAGIVRAGLQGLEKAEKEPFDPNDPFGEKPKPVKRDRPSEEYRYLLSFPERNLEQDAASLVKLYQLAVPSTSFETARAIFGQMKAGQLGPEADFAPRFEAELALTGDVELGRRGLAGHFPGTLADREALKATLSDPADFNLLLTEHRSGERLEEELESLRLVQKTLGGEVGAEKAREAYSQLMTSLREGPWSGRPVAEATTEFLRNYALQNDLKHALDSLQLAPDGKSGIQETDRQVIIGGVRIRRR